MQKNYFNAVRKFVRGGSFRYADEGAYVFTGTSAINWTLPPLYPAGTVYKRDAMSFTTQNRGTAILTMGSSDGTSQFSSKLNASTPVYPGDVSFAIPVGNAWTVAVIKSPNRESSGVVSNAVAAYSVPVSSGTIVADCTAAPCVHTLPLAADAFQNGIGCKYTLVKTDASANAASFIPQGSDTLNGATSAKLITARWGGLTVQAISSTAYVVISQI